MKTYFKIICLIFLVSILVPFLTEAITFGPPFETKSFEELIDAIADFIFWAAMAIAPILIIVAAFYFLTSGGDPEKVKTAKRIIFWTFIGLIIVLLGKGIVATIGQLLGGGPSGPPPPPSVTLNVSPVSPWWVNETLTLTATVTKGGVPWQGAQVNFDLLIYLNPPTIGYSIGVVNTNAQGIATLTYVIPNTRNSTTLPGHTIGFRAFENSTMVVSNTVTGDCLASPPHGPCDIGDCMPAVTCNSAGGICDYSDPDCNFSGLCCCTGIPSLTCASIGFHCCCCGGCRGWHRNDLDPTCGAGEDCCQLGCCPDLNPGETCPVTCGDLCHCPSQGNYIPPGTTCH